MQPSILIYGYGNPGRQDDGLGNAFIEKIDKWLVESMISNVETDSNYQLNIEDADSIKDKDIVIFVDASVEDIDSFQLTPVKPSAAVIEFTMHAVSTSFILDLCQKLYGKYPETWLLHIKGFEWEFEEKLSPDAAQNLDSAFEFIKTVIKNPDILRLYSYVKQ